MRDIEIILKNTPSFWDVLKNERPPLVLYGMGDGAVKLLDILDKLGLECKGVFASDGFVRHQSFMGYTVKSLSELEDELGDFVVLSAFATRLDSVMENFDNISRRHRLIVPDINVSGNHLELFDAEFVERFSSRIENAYNALDADGKKMYEAIVEYKLCGTLESLKKIELCRQSFISPYPNETIKAFADFGAYTGDTVLKAVEEYPNLEKIAAFEPDPKSFKKLCTNTQEIRAQMHLYNAPVWDSDTEINLRSGGAMNTIIEDNVLIRENLQKKKCTCVKAVCPDACMPFLPDLIKMDIEGCESRAIDGCNRIITEKKPIMRIAMYHNHRDIFELYEKLSQTNSSYRYTITQKCRYIPAWDTELIAY